MDKKISDNVKSIRENVGLFDLSSRGKLKLSGEEHLKLLQGMLSNDVVKLEPQRGVYATSLTPKGKMVADMTVHKFDGSVILDLEPCVTEQFYEHLLKYRLSYRASIENLTQELGLFHICGKNAAQIVDKTFDTIPQIPLNEFDCMEYKEDDSIDPIKFLVKMNRTGETGYDIYTVGCTSVRDTVANAVFKGFMSSVVVKQNNGKELGLDDMDVLRIEAGIPKWGKDMDENTMPIEAGLWKALDFEKGCYVGQEVVARIKWRGRVNWHLIGFKIDGEKVPKAGSEVFVEDKKVGRLTSPTYSPNLNCIISLGYIRRESNKEGLSVEVVDVSDGSKTEAVTCFLPFINNFS